MINALYYGYLIMAMALVSHGTLYFQFSLGTLMSVLDVMAKGWVYNGIYVHAHVTGS